jgi:S1-C subfamily serine protease
MRDGMPSALSAGFFVAPDVVATSNHGVAGRHKPMIKTRDGKELKVLAIHRDESCDLALIRVTPQGVALAMADPEVGQRVATVAHPHGWKWTVTSGVVSADDREVTMQDKSFDGLLQVDCPINVGCSGGPLVDENGRAVGMVLAYKTSAAGIAFGLPLRKIKEVMEAWQR